MLALVVGVALGACGGDEQASTEATDTPGPKQASPPRLGSNIVTDDQIAEEPRGSPGNALLRWWQSVQFTDVEAVKELTSSGLKRQFGASRLDKLVRAAGPALGGLGVVNTKEEGKSATLRIAVVAYDGGKPALGSTFPLTVSMREEKGGWRYDDVEYLRTLAKNYLPR